MTAGAAALPALVRVRLLSEARSLRTRFLGLGLAALVTLDYLTAEQGALGAAGGAAKAANDVLEVVLPFVLSLLPALSLATLRELRLHRERHLDGVEMWRGALGEAVAAALITLALVLAALLLGGLLGAVDSLVRSPPPGPSPGARAADDLAEFAAQLVVALPLWTAIGSAIGFLAGSRFAATACVLGLGLLEMLLLQAAVEFPGVEPIFALTPQGALDLTVGDSSVDPSAPFGDPLFLDAVIALWIAASLTVLRAAIRRGVRPAAEESAGRRRRPRAADLGLAGSFVLLVFGYVVPTALSESISWYYRPAWLVDKATGKASDDVTARYLDLLDRGRDAQAERLTVAKRPFAPLGGLRDELVPKPRGLTVRTIEDQNGAPGEVKIDIGESGTQTQYTACLSRRSGKWLIDSVNTRGVCE
jgi:hypothetical protein